MGSGMHVPERYRQETAVLSDDAIVDWIFKLKAQ